MVVGSTVLIPTDGVFFLLLLVVLFHMGRSLDLHPHFLQVQRQPFHPAQLNRLCGIHSCRFCTRRPTVSLGFDFENEDAKMRTRYTCDQPCVSPAKSTYAVADAHGRLSEPFELILEVLEKGWGSMSYNVSNSSVLVFYRFVVRQSGYL